MTRPKRTRWGEGRLELLTKLWNEGVEVPLIAETFGMHPEAIRAAARHYKLPRRSRGRKKGYVCEHRVKPAAPKPVRAIDNAPGWPTRDQLMGCR